MVTVRNPWEGARGLSNQVLLQWLLLNTRLFSAGLAGDWHSFHPSVAGHLVDSVFSLDTSPVSDPSLHCQVNPTLLVQPVSDRLEARLYGGLEMCELHF